MQTTQPPTTAADYLDAMVREMAINLDAIADRATALQRRLLAQWYGPEGPLPLYRIRVIHAAVIAALAQCSPMSIFGIWNCRGNPRGAHERPAWQA